MKRLFKKGLSLLLAVLMVASMLPTSAWAVTFADGEDSGREETPVMDVGGDSSATAHSTGNGGTVREIYEEEPEPDPSEGPGPSADPSWTGLDDYLLLEIDRNGDFTIKVAANAISMGGGSGQVGFAVMLDRKGTGSVAVAPSELPVGSSHTNATALRSLVEATTLPTSLYYVGGDESFTFGADGSYNGTTLSGSLGPYQDFLAAAQAIDSGITGMIPLRVFLVTSEGDGATSLSGASQATFNWSGGKDADLTARNLNGGTQTADGGTVPGDGYVELTQPSNLTGAAPMTQTFNVLAKDVNETGNTITIKSLTYAGTGQSDNGTRIRVTSANPSVNTTDAVQVTLNVDGAAWRPANNASGLIEGVITITYTVDGGDGTEKTLEVPVHTKMAGTMTGLSITIKAEANDTKTTGGKTTLSYTGTNPATLVSNDLFNYLIDNKDITHDSITTNTEDENVTGITWGLEMTLPEPAHWDDDGFTTWTDDSGFTSKGGAISLSGPVGWAQVKSDVTPGTYYVGVLLLPWADSDSALNPVTGGIASIPVFVEVIEGEVVPPEKNTFTLTYNLDGGTGGPDSPESQEVEGTSYDFTPVFGDATNPTKEGFNFLGWADAKGESTPKYTGTQKVTANTTTPNVTVYAVWKQITNNITYAVDTSGPSGVGIVSGKSPVAVNYGADHSVQTAAETISLPEGAAWDTTDTSLLKLANGQVWDFTGWLDDVTSATAGATIENVVAPHTLTAQWDRVKYTVTYQNPSSDAPAGAFVMPTQDPVDSGESFTVADKPTKPADATWGSDTLANRLTLANGEIWEFGGWTGSGGVTAGTYQPGDKPTPTANTTMTADWTRMYTVTYAAGDAGDDVAGLPGAAVEAAGAEHTIAASPTWAGHTFSHWTSSVEGDTNKYIKDGGTGFESGITVNSNITLTAVWTENPGDAKVTILIDGVADNTDVTSVKVYNVALSWNATDSVYETTGGQLAAGKYHVVVNDVDTGVEITVPMGDTGEATVEYYTVSVATDGNGEATVKTESDKRLGDASATATDGTAKSIVIQSGESATWSFGDPDLYYQAKGWDSGSSTTAITTAISSATDAADKTHTAHFEKKTFTLTVNMKKNGAAWANSGDKVVPVVNQSDANQDSPLTLTPNAADNTYTAYTTTVTAGETYYIWPKVVNAGGSGYVTTPIKVEVGNAAPDAQDLEYFDLTVTAKRDVDAGAKVDQDLTTAAAAVESEGPTTYYTGTTVQIDAAPSDSTNYNFVNWTASDGGSAPADANDASTTVDVTAETTLTATFAEKAYTSVLTVTVDGESDVTKWTSGDVTGAKLVDKDGGKITGVTVTQVQVDDADTNQWQATGVPTAPATGKGPYKWVVTTLSGDYETNVANDNRNAKMDLFTVTVANGTGNDDSHKPTIGSSGQRAIGPIGTAFTLAANPKSTAFTQKAHPNGWAKEENYGTVNSNTQYTISEGTTGTQELTPQYTYSVTVVPTRDAAATPVVPMSSGVTAVTVDGKTATKGADDKWTVSGLEGDTLAVTVNGFTSSVTVSETNAGGEVAVQMYEIKTAKSPDGGTAYVALGTAMGNATAVYVPVGASSTAAGATAVSIQAAATTGYRLVDPATYTVTDKDQHTWTITDGATVANADAVAARTTVSFSSIAGDITATAHFVQQFTVEATKTHEYGDSDNTPTVTTGTGSVSGKVATVDATKAVTLTATVDDSQQVKGWSVTSGAGTAYSNADLAEEHKIADLTKYTGTVVYFVPTADSVVNVDFESRRYDVVITVNKNNSAYTGLTVELWSDGDGAAKVADATWDADSSTYKANVVAGTYSIRTNGLAGSGDAEDTGRDVTVGASPATNAAELNYYVLTLAKKFSDDPDPKPTTLHVNYGSDATADADPLTKIVLAGAGDDTLNVDIAATEDNHAEANRPNFYSWDSWTDTKDDGTTAVGGTTPTTAGGAYVLPGENKLKADNLGDTGVTLTAVFTRDPLYDVVFDINTPSGADSDTFVSNPASVDAVENRLAGEEVTLTELADTKENYIFKGWAMAADAASKDYDPDGTYTVLATDADTSGEGNGQITLYGVWVKKVVVTFDLDGGHWVNSGDITAAGDQNTNIVRKGEGGVDPLTAPGNPAKDGYEFKAWDPTVDAKYPNADQTYKATWTAKKYKYIFNANGGEWTADHAASKEREYETDARVSAWETDPERTGYTFKGWTAVKDTGPVLVYNDDDHPITMPPKEVTVYALWEANTYKVTYAPGAAGGDVGASIVDLNGEEEGSQDYVTFVYAGDTTNAKPGAKDAEGTAIQWADGKGEGWTFKNWKSDDTDGAQTYAAGDDLKTSNKAYNFTLTAQWTVDVTFDLNAPETGSVEGAAISVPNPVAVDHNDTISNIDGKMTGTAKDYTFAGWYTTDGSDLENAPGVKATDSTQFTEPTTLYARWTAKTYTFTFDANGGDWGEGEDSNPITQQITTGNVGDDINGPGAATWSDPTRADYDLAGWAYKKDDDTLDTPLAPGAIPTKLSAENDGKTLFAVWTLKNYEYIFDANGGDWGKDAEENPITEQKRTGLHVGDAVDEWPTGESETAPTWKDHAFKGWATTAINSVSDKLDYSDGKQKMPSEPTDGKVTVYAIWVPVYDVTYVIGDHGTKDNTKDVVDQEEGLYKVEAQNAVITASTTDETWDTTNNYFTDATGHWKFLYWEADDTSNTHYAGGQQFNLNRDTVLTAVWEETYLVTLGAAASAADGTTLPSADVSTTKATFNGTDLNTAAGGTRSIWVKVGDPVKITSVGVDGAKKDEYFFAQWTATDSTGDFGADGPTKAVTDFTPTADTTLTPNYWHEPALSGAQKHHLNKAVDEVIADAPWSGAQNALPVYTWTQNDATLKTDPKLEISSDGGTTWTTLNVAGAGADVVEKDNGDGTITYTFQRDYLVKLPMPDGVTHKTFKVRVNSDTPSDGGLNARPTNLEANLDIYVTPEKLTLVDIWAKDGVNKSTTANVNEAVGRDGVVYNRHEDTKIEAANKLTYTWYVGDKNPSLQGSYTTTLAASIAGTSVNNAKTAAADEGTPITGKVDVTDDHVDITGDASYKGKWIYAVVAASGTGYGAVITNAIAVDYDAAIQVKKDDNLILDTAAGNYKVYLVRNSATVAPVLNATNNGLAEVPGDVVATTYVEADDVFQTADSALLGGETYTVYVNKVEGDTATFVPTTVTVDTQVNADAPKTVDFYSVNKANADPNHAKDNSATPQKVGETFAESGTNAVPGTGFTTDRANTGAVTYGSDTTIDVTDGNGVLKGSDITAKTGSKEWTQDYHVDWNHGTGATKPTLTFDESNKQTKDDACDTGYTKVQNIGAKTWIGAQLHQNVYEVTGNIWVMGTNKQAGVLTDADHIPTLTYKNGETTYTFKPTSAGSGVHQGTMTFKVPRSGVTDAAISGQYVITAQPKTTPKTTILKYIPGQDVTMATNASIEAVNALDPKQTLADVPAGGVSDPMFTIVVDSSTYVLEIRNVDGSGDSTKDTASERSVTSTLSAAQDYPTSTPGYVGMSWTESYAYTTPGSYKVRVTNKGNTDLTLALNLQKTLADGSSSSIFSTTGTTMTAGIGTHTDANKVVFGDLVAEFDLDAGESKEFTVTIPLGLAVSEAATYDFQFSSKEQGVSVDPYGPSVTYRLTQKIDPLEVEHVKAVSTDTDENGKKIWKPTELTISGKTDEAIPEGVKLPKDGETAPDVVYDWYAVPHGTAVNQTATNTSGKLTLADGTTPDPIAPGTKGVDANGLSYTENDEHKGMDIYLVARGSGTGNVIKAYLTDPPQIIVNYDLDILVKENDALTQKEENYKVYLWPNKVRKADGTLEDNTETFTATNAKTIVAESGTTTDGHYTAKGLDPDVTYTIYTNAVGGATGVNLQNSNVTAAYTNFQTRKAPEVIYRDVTVNNTTVDNGAYDSAIGANNPDPFLTTYSAVEADRDSSTLPDGIKNPAASVGAGSDKTDVATTEVNKWVQSGTTVDLAYNAWTKDYTLSWDGATTADADADKDPATASAATKQVTDEATVIKTKLTLNLYNMPVYVIGDAGGTISEIKLTNKGAGLSFTTKDDGSGLYNGTKGVVNSVVVPNAATFHVPAGTYTVSAEKAAGTTIQGYRKCATTHDTTPPSDYTGLNKSGVDVTVAKVGGDVDADVIVTATGQIMTVTDNAKTVDSKLENAVGGASYDGTVSHTDAATTLTLPYGYSEKELELTVANQSSGTDSIFNVTMDVSGMSTESLITITAPASADAIAMDGSKDFAKGESSKVKINIAKGLGTGSYTSNVKVSFNSESNAGDKAEMTYTLTVVVEPAKFTAVTMKAADNSDISTMIPYGVDLEASGFTTSDPDLGGLTSGDTNYLDPGTAYRYEWYATAADATLSDAWADGALTTTTGATPLGTGATLDKAVIAGHPGEKIWLAIVAKDGQNVINAAVTGQVTGYRPKVTVREDGTSIPAGDAGSYTVKLVAGGGTIIPTVWDTDGFVPAAADGTQISLAADEEYRVYVNAYEGQSITSGITGMVDSGKTVKLNQDATVDFYTVHPVEVKDYEAISGLGETFDETDPLPTPTFTLSSDSSVTVTATMGILKDQTVDAKMGSWDQDYKLTWYTAATAGDAPVPGATPADPGAYADTSPTMTKGDTQNLATATGTGITGVAVTNKTYIGGRLDQNTYSIKGTVKGTGSLSFAGLDKMVEDASVKGWAFPTATGKEVASAYTSSDGSTLAAGAGKSETVTFTVVRGQFDISVAPSVGTVVKSMKWESDDAAVNDVTVLTGKNVTAAAGGLGGTVYNFEVVLEATDLKLGVNDPASAKSATSTTTTFQSASNGLTRYFSYIQKAQNDSQTAATSAFPLVLENPGNKDLDVGMEVFYFSAADKANLTSAYFNNAANWEGAGAANTPIFTAADGTSTADLAATGGSTETVLALSDLMGDSVTVPKGAAYNATPGSDTSVAVGTVTLGEDAWAKDRGAFVFRFKGATGEAGDDPVVVYYVLDLTVEQLPIKKVETQMKDGEGNELTTMPGVGDVLEAKGYGTTDASLDNVTVQRSSTGIDVTVQAATEAKLTDDDIHFAWVSVPGGTTGDILGHFQINAGGVLEAKNTTNDKVLSANANAKTYTVTANELNRDLYLIAYAPNTTAQPQKTNATGMAISAVIQAKRTVGVQISLDGPSNIQNGGTDGKGPGYVVFLVEKDQTLAVTKNADGSYTTGAGTWATTWNNTDKMYEAAIDLNTTYEIYAPSYQGGENFVNTDLTLGKKAGGTGTDVKQIVPYWSVAHTANVAVDNTYDKFVNYLPAGVATDANAIQNALTVAVSDDKDVTTYDKGNTLAGANVPVLSGMNVRVTVDAAKTSGNTTAAVKSWSEASDLHTMTTQGWKKDSTDSATTTREEGLTYPTPAGDPAQYLIQSGNIAVDAAKSFSATLKQQLFDVTFKVKDNTPDETKTETGYVPASVAKVKLIPDGSKETQGAASTFEVGLYTDLGTVGNVSNGTDGHPGTAGATVTIKQVPKGGFEVQVSETGNRTKVDGYTWNADDVDVYSESGKIVDTDTTTTVNQHLGNTVQIEYSSYAVQWKDNFVTTDGSADPNQLFNSTGFEKTDKAGGPYLALTAGYSSDEDAVLTYKVRVENTGAMPLANFWINQTDKANLIADLTQVTITRKADDSTETADVSNPGSITLNIGDAVDFTVTIPSGDDEKAASGTNYASAFEVKSSSSSNISKATYQPEYQVKSNVSVAGGSAAIYYGDDAFDGAATQIAVTNGFVGQNFAYAILTEAELTTYLDGVARPDNAYTSDGYTYGGSTTHKSPDWLKLGSDGVFTVTGDPATGVHVKKDANGDDVTDELVVYVKVTSANDELLKKIVPFTVNVKTSKLKIVTANTADSRTQTDAEKEADGNAYRDLYKAPITDPYHGQGEDIAHGVKVLLEYFNYTQVENTNNAADTVDTNGHTAYAAGANRWDPADGAPNTGYGEVTLGTWSVTDPVPDVFDGTGDTPYDPESGTATNANNYVFTYTYTGTGDADKYDYEGADITLTIPALVPPNFRVTYKNADPSLPQVTVPTDANSPYEPASTVTVLGVTGLAVGDERTAADYKLYKFLGWDKSGDTTTNKYYSSGTGMTTSFTINADAVFTATWEEITYSVTYVPGATDVTGMPDPATFTGLSNNTSHTIVSDEPSRAGYTFTGWKSNVAGDTNNYKKDGAGNQTAITVNSNITLTAQWSRDQSKIIYDWNYDGSTNVTHTGNTGDPDTKPGTAPARTGYTWDGKWYVEPACATEQTTFTFPAIKDDTVTYYAKWTRDTSKIDFKLDGGTLEGWPKAEPYTGNTGEALAAENFPAGTPSKAGYTFTGWHGDDGATYTAADLPSFPATKDATLTITAGWSRDQATITFDLGGGNIDGETEDVVRNGPTGTQLPVLSFPENPERDGYAFEGWLGEDGNTYTSDDRPYFPDGKGGDLAITAQWRELVQGLRFSDERSNDAAVNDANGKITMVDPDAVLTAPDLQKAFPPARKVERTGEYIVYLDTEPRYTVALHSDGDPVYDLSVTATDARGVKYSDLPVNVESFSSEDDVKVITLDLEALSGKLWAGEHHILLTARGNTKADGTGETVTATYELTFVIQKKPIPGANVIPDPTDPTNPGKTKVTDPEGKDLRQPDPKGNTPVDPPVITKTPTDPKPGETYEIKTTLEPDPNYTFEPENDPKDPTEKPNYTQGGKGDKEWPEGNPDLSVTVKPEDPGADVTYVVTMREPLVTIGAHLVTANDDAAVTTNFATLIGKELRDYRAQSDDTEKYPRTGTTYGTDWWWSMGDASSAVLDIQPGTDANGKEIKAPKFEYNKTYVLTVKLDPDEVNYRFADFADMKATFDKDNEKLWFEKENGGNLTRRANAGELQANTQGFTILTEENGNYYLRTYYIARKSTGGGGGGGSTPSCPSQVTYLLGLYGTTKDPVMEMVSGNKVTQVPNVSAIAGYKFLGWSLAGPIGDADKDAARTLVDPKEVPIEGDTTFYAVYQPLYTHGRPFHEHYVIGYPNGNFGPSDNINRASVATIIARAVLPNFVEGADYGNPGGYSDVSDHWAASAIAYCTRYGVFKGYEDGTFRPDQPISRQELVLTLARLSGMQEGTAPFSDLNEAGDWAKGAIYTAYVKGWVNGYTDGTFRPTNPIARDETVKIFNAYLYRGVDAEGLSALTEYVHSGVASNNTENGTTEYMTWPDVPKDQWAYYEIIEAANDHEYKPDETKKAGYTVPEVWTKCWIDEKWRYNDNPNDGGPAAVTMALLRKYGVIA